MRSLIKKILKEEHQPGPTETERLYWKLPKKMVEELNIELFSKDDIVYITEIHFDTQNVLFEFFHVDQFGDEEHYENSFEVPGHMTCDLLLPIKKLPKNILLFILRRLDSNYMKYLKL